MNLFMNKDEEFSIKINVSEHDGQVYCWVTGSNPPKEVDHVCSYEIFFRYPLYKDNMAFLDAGIKIDESGNFSFVSNQARYHRFITLLKRWDIKDANGKIVEAIPENAEKLAPAVLGVIVSELDKVLKTE